MQNNKDLLDWILYRVSYHEYKSIEMVGIMVTGLFSSKLVFSELVVVLYSWVLCYLPKYLVSGS